MSWSLYFQCQLFLCVCEISQNPFNTHLCKKNYAVWGRFLFASNHKNKLKKNNLNTTPKFLAWVIGLIVVPLNKIGIIGEEEGVILRKGDCYSFGHVEL